MNLTRNDVDWKSLLIKKYQSYGLDELDTMVIFVSDAVLSIQENTLLTCDILSPYMKATKDVIDQSLSKLMSKKYLTIVRKGNSFFSSLEGFKDQLFKDEIKDLILKDGSETSATLLSENLYSYLEGINGPLSPLEKDKVTQWIKSGADENMIKEACKKSVTKSGHISFKSADSLLLQMQRSESRKTIGVSTVNEEENKSAALQKLIESTTW